MVRSNRRKGKPVLQFLAELANDEEYQRGAQKLNAEIAARTAALRQAEQPIVSDLHDSGLDVSSVWDLVNTSEPYPTALPVLMKHLEFGHYPDRVMESLGSALAVKPAVAFWNRLKALYLNARSPGEETGTAVALAAMATPEQLEDLIEFLSVDKRGDSRIYFIRPILRVGGQRGREIVEGLVSNPVFGKEASALLRRRGSRPTTA